MANTPSQFIPRATLALSVMGDRCRDNLKKSQWADGVEPQTHCLQRAELSRAGLCVLILGAQKAVHDAAHF